MDSKILNIIDELKELQILLEKSVKSGEIPAIEIDIAKSRLQQIYNSIIHLQHSQTSDSKIKETNIFKTEPENNIVKQIKNSKDIKLLEKPYIILKVNGRNLLKRCLRIKAFQPKELF